MGAQGGHQWQWGFLRMQWAYFPSFVSFYFMGTLAKRNSWLETMTSRDLKQKLPMLAAAVISAVGLIIVVVHTEHLSPGAISACWGVLAGIFSVSFANVVIMGFATWGNVCNSYTMFMGRAAYAVYLIHDIFVLALAFCFSLILKSFGIDALAPGFISPNDWLLVGGGAFVAFIGLPLVWTFSFFLCKVPVLRDII